ncbi:MAG: energy-coupling factor transporter ATPase [Clostridia bacterium]|nr:energy-coupling factor transporter ATPase [Clostridia bacterium]
MALLQTNSISFGYSHGTPFEITALDHVSFSVDKGETVAVIGHTGSGKSTLMQMLNGLLKPESGAVLMEDRDIHADKQQTRQIRFRVGLCFQYPEYQLFEETCFKDISFGPKNMGLSEEEIRQRVLQAAKIVGLPEELLEKSPFDLSGGQKRRCAIAGVMAMQPEVLILDEPTAGLDPRGRDAVFAMIRSYQRQTNAAVVIVTHSMEDAAQFADRIVVMSQGRLVLDGTADEIFSSAEELMNMGLNVPASTRLVNELRSLGYDLPRNVYTAQAAAEEIASCLRRSRP